jgi:hypothetical protein
MKTNPDIFKFGALVVECSALLYTFLFAASLIAAIRTPAEFSIGEAWHYPMYFGAACGLWLLGMMLEIMAMVVFRARVRMIRVQTNALTPAPEISPIN